MKELDWEEARDITEAYFLPYKCVVDKDESDHQNVVAFVVYFDYDSSEDRYGPCELSKFKDPKRLEYMLSKHKEHFEQIIREQ